MPLYELKPRENLPKGDDPWEEWWDKAHGFIVSAKSEEDARLVASTGAGDEGGEVWLSDKYTTVKRLGRMPNGTIIMRDYHAG